MTQGKEIKKHNGAEYHDYELADVEGVMASGPSRTVIEGTFCLTYAPEMEKYGEQVVLQVWNDDMVEFQERNGSTDYNRLEIYFDLDNHDHVLALKLLQQKLKEVLSQLDPVLTAESMGEVNRIIDQTPEKTGEELIE